MIARAVWLATLLIGALSFLHTSAAAPQAWKRSVGHTLNPNESEQQRYAALSEKHEIFGSVNFENGKYSFERGKAAGNFLPLVFQLF